MKLPPRLAHANDLGKLGPAMQALTPMQRLFVDELLSAGDDNHTRAARAAGYSDKSNGCTVVGHRLAHDEKILIAIREEGERRIGSSVAMATSVVADIARTQGHRQQLKAAEMILNRAGLHARTEHNVNVHHRKTDDASLTAEISALCKTLGIDPKKLLGGQAPLPVLDADFQEVTDWGAEKIEIAPEDEDWSSL